MKRAKMLLAAALIGAAFLVKAGPQLSSISNSFTPRAVHVSGITNLFQLSDHIYSGSAPEGPQGFAAVQNLGIQTIISVDGIRPDTELAHKYGLQYIHIPHGYDGISTNVQVELIKAAQTAASPVLVHCHHGTNRGPTAAAVICMGIEGWSAADGMTWLKAAGTSTNYGGLFETVRNFHLPTADELKSAPKDYPEIAKVSDLVDLMVAIDRTWEYLKTVRKENFRSLRDHPDIHPAGEMVILWEHFREAQRLAVAKARGADLLERLKSMEIMVQESVDLISKAGDVTSPEVRAQLDRRFDRIGEACASCHKAYRDSNKADLTSRLARGGIMR